MRKLILELFHKCDISHDLGYRRISLREWVVSLNAVNENSEIKIITGITLFDF